MEKVLDEQQTLKLILERIDKLTLEIKGMKPEYDARITNLSELNADFWNRIIDLENAVFDFEEAPKITEEKNEEEKKQ